MSRIIKFRTWSKTYKKMLNVSTLKIAQDTAICVDKDIQIYRQPRPMEKGVPMQYTGLKDKNDKEIYEGDIVKWKDTEVGVVSWGYDSWRIDFDKGRKQFLSDHWESSEVIGNIHENSELLDK